MDFFNLNCYHLGWWERENPKLHPGQPNTVAGIALTIGDKIKASYEAFPYDVCCFSALLLTTRYVIYVTPLSVPGVWRKYVILV